MNYKSFEDLPIWQASIEFAIRVFQLTNKADFRGVGGALKINLNEPPFPFQIILSKVLNAAQILN